MSQIVAFCADHEIQKLFKTVKSDLFLGGGDCSSYIKNKSFSVITEKVNREISTKNLVTLKRSDGVKDKNFNEGSLKNLIFRRGSQKPIHRRISLKRGLDSV